MRNILLIEPSYRNKYPPLALMKISTYHKRLRDNVVFCKGKNKDLRDIKWDRIYISTLFTFYWATTIDTIHYYKESVEELSHIYCGGVMATVLRDELCKEYPVTVISGLIDRPGILDNNDIIVDTLAPDYSIVDIQQNKYLTYQYPIKDAYISYTTRGCIRKCAFCAVPTIEPRFNGYINIKPQIEYIKSMYGEKKHLMLLDNNVLASKDFNKIIEDIKELGFYKGAKYATTKNGRTTKSNRYVDFNQGIDARLLTEEKCKKLSEIAINPLRIAFDHADQESVDLYMEKVRMAASYGIKYLSNYVLFNFTDTPEDLYNRLNINVTLNEEFERNKLITKIFSFPMKFTPIDGENCTDRKYVGVSWNKKYLRAIQCILNATHGVVGHKRSFFNRAFGNNLEEFLLILSLPEKFILQRSEYELSGQRAAWQEKFLRLSKGDSVLDIIQNGDLKSLNANNLEHEILSFYCN